MTTAIVAALIGSAPGWAGVWVMLHGQRAGFRKLDSKTDQQTEAIKDHITQAAVAPVRAATVQEGGE